MAIFFLLISDILWNKRLTEKIKVCCSPKLFVLPCTLRQILSKRIDSKLNELALYLALNWYVVYV